MWHVSSRSGVATLRTAIHLLFTYLLATWRVVKKTSIGYGTDGKTYSESRVRDVVACCRCRQAAVCGRSQERGVHLGEEDSQRDVLGAERAGAELRVAAGRAATARQRHFPHLLRRQSLHPAGARFTPLSSTQRRTPMSNTWLAAWRSG